MAVTLWVSLLIVGLVTAQETSMDEQNDGSVIQGASELSMKSNSTVGEDMFEMSGGTDSETKVKFGFAQIVELDGDGNTIDIEKHACNFHKDNITCETSAEEKGNMTAVDDLGDPTVAKYTRITKTCSLASCNKNADAKLLISSYIMLNKAYICQPNCDAEEQFQSPVFNGTAKWEVELNNWDFCSDSESACEGKNATNMKIYFSLRGSKNGKEMKPKKKAKVPFDQSKGKAAEKCKAKYEATANETDTSQDENTENVDKRNAENGGKGKPGKPDTAGRGQKGDRKGKGKCRNSLSSSFGDEPDDQDSFSLADDSGTEAAPVIRLYGMAILDSAIVVSNGTGFVGPLVETATFKVGNSQQDKTRDYVTIQVPKFNTKVVYDPTVDMDSTGGTLGDAENAASGFYPSLLFVGVAVLLMDGLVLV